MKLAKTADNISPFIKGVEILPDGSVSRYSGTNFSERVKEAHDAPKASIQSINLKQSCTVYKKVIPF
ncbi:hypothetical protein ABE072_29745 [Bacillus paramycoides]